MAEQDDYDEGPEGQSMQSNETDEPSAIAYTITDVVVVHNLFNLSTSFMDSAILLAESELKVLENYNSCA